MTRDDYEGRNIDPAVPSEPTGDATPENTVPENTVTGDRDANEPTRPMGWVPATAPTPPGGYSWGSAGSAPAPTPAPNATRRRRVEPARLVAAALIVVAGALGYVFGHGTIGTSQTFPAQASRGELPGVPSGGGGSGAPNGFGGFGVGPGSGFGYYGYTAPGAGQAQPGAAGETPAAGKGAPSDVAAIAKTVSPALVDVDSTFGYEDAEGAGTGIVLTADGIILTNNHVVNGATKISVTDIGNGKTYAATVLGYDDSHDIAVLRLTGASGLTTAHIGDSAKLTVGEPVVAIGNAGGAGGTPTSAGGSVTALDQSITASDSLDGTNEQLTGLIEVNADVQSGDSGGSLVNASGDVVGVDSAASTQFSFNQSSQASQGYAIPINEALSIERAVVAGKANATIHVGSTAFLGVGVAPAQSAGLGGGASFGFGFGNGSGFGNSAPVSGAELENVIPGDPAANAGLVAGDTITSIANKPVTSSQTLLADLVPYHGGDTVELGWTDTSGTTHKTTVTLASGPPA